MAHAHAHHHGHSHGHTHGPANFDTAFAVGIALNLGFVAIEVGAGIAAGSMALVADAGHNASDVLALVLAWAASWASRRPPRGRFTYGFGRSSIVASLVNAVALLVAVGVIVAEAVERLQHPAPVATGVVAAVAGAGILVNGVTAWLFARGARGDINIRGAFLHMLADAAVSAGVVAAALLIGVTGWLWLDPAAALTIAAVITYGTWGLLRESVRLTLDAVPAGIDAAKVTAYLRGLPGVCAVHDMHIWPMSTASIALTVHLAVDVPGPHDALLARIAHDLAHDHGIGHATVQVETADADCKLAAGHRI